MTKENLITLKERIIGLKDKKNELEISYPNKKNFKKAMVASALGLSLAIGTTSVPVLNNVSIVEAAKKDKKKPKIKLSGQKKLEIEEGEKVTIPKTTYSDNKTKKKKLKVGVTVKKGSKKYSSIAKKIKKATLKSKPVAVEFPEEGTYKITTTVTDLAKNKATAVRTVVVNEKDVVIDDQQIDVKQDPITEEPVKKVVTPETPTTTEAPTTTETPKTEEPKKEEPTSENNTTEQSTTEDQTKEETTTLPADIAKTTYVKQVIVDDHTYNVVSNEAYAYEYDYKPELNYTIGFETNCSNVAFKYDYDMISKYEFLRYLGNLCVYDENGNDISNRVMIYEEFSGNPREGGFEMRIIVTDGNYNYDYVTIPVSILSVDNDFSTCIEAGYIKINSNPDIYIQERQNNKKLILKND